MVVERKDLDNSFRLNAKYTKYTINNDNVMECFWKIIYGDKRFAKDSKQTNHLNIVLSNLYSCHKSLYDFVGYSRNSNDYIIYEDDSCHNLSYRVIVKIINRLLECDYIEHHIGYYDQNKKSGKTSRMKATGKLIDEIESYPDAVHYDEQNQIYDLENNFIVLKDFNKRTVRYQKTYLTDEWNGVLIEYNNMLSQSQIALSKPYPEKVNYDNKLVKRSFNDESFGLGGRFYGGWWQNIKKKYRNYILINGEETTEIDFKSLHLILLYATDGIDYIQDIDGDPYLIDEIDKSDSNRKLIKKIMLTIINCKSKTSAIQSLNKDIRDSEITNHTGYKIPQLLEMVEKKHIKISKYFYYDVGKLLQYNDSAIAHNLIKEFTEANIPILCVHDSFICQKQYGEELNNRMIRSFENTYGTKIILTEV